MTKTWIVLGCALAGLGVAAGAFGAHALEGSVPTDLLAVYETAARYQLTHALGLLFVGIASTRWPDRRWDIAGWMFASGIFVFSGSLYALSLTGSRWLGAITPIGGACFLVGWVAAALAGCRISSQPVPRVVKGGVE